MDNTMKRSATYLLGVLLLLAAGSCSVQKKCKAPQLDMPAEIVAGQSDTLTLSDRKWWEVYTDTTLCRLIGRTLDRNRNMLSAEARIRQLEELYRVSKAARLPSLGGLAAAAFDGATAALAKLWNKTGYKPKTKWGRVIAAGGQTGGERKEKRDSEQLP